MTARLHQEVEEVLVAPDMRERLSSAGGEAVPGSTAMFSDLLKKERQRYEKLIREAHINPD